MNVLCIPHFVFSSVFAKEGPWSAENEIYIYSFLQKQTLQSFLCNFKIHSLPLNLDISIPRDNFQRWGESLFHSLPNLV